MTVLRLKYVNVKFGNSDAIKFVANSWLKSYQEYVEKANDGNMDSKVFFKTMIPITNRLMRRRRVIIAELADEDDCYVGWVCGAQGELCYVYVKKAYRRGGIAKELIRRACGYQGIYRYPSKNIMFNKWLDRSYIYKPIEERKSNGTDKENTSGMAPSENG